MTLDASRLTPDASRVSLHASRFILAAILAVQTAAGAQPEVKPEDSVVFIRTANSLRTARGSGFLVGDGGWVVTASHVVSADLDRGKRVWDRTVTVYVPWTGRPYEARVAAVDGVADVALLRLPEVGFPALPLEGLEVRDAGAALETLKDRPIRLYGFPLSYGEDTVAALAKPERNNSTLREIARRGELNLCVLNPCPDAQPGWSGGPVIAADKGTVVAVFHSLYRPTPAADPGYPTGSLTAYLGDLLRKTGVTNLAAFSRTSPPTQARPAGAAERLAHDLRGLSWGSVGNWKKAEEEQREVLKDAPDDPAARAELGKVLLEQQQYEAAVKELRAAARLAPRSLTAHLYLGKALHLNYEPKAAIEVLRTAMEISPEEMEPRLALAQVHEENQRAEEAIVVLRAALEKAPEHPAVMYRLGDLLSRSRVKAEHDEGTKLLSQAAALAAVDPGLSYIPLGYARVLEAARKYREVESLFRQVLKLNKENALAHYQFALYYLRRKQVDEAQIHLNAGIQVQGISESLLQAFRNLQLQLNEAAAAPEK